MSIRQMARAGLWLNVIGTLVITLFAKVLMPAVWGIDVNVPPLWAAPRP